jgi:catechol 2,3-dioxygenase-like lactoylglutathione lyase family enzyme
VDVIKGMHAMFYTSDAEATRAFFRDKLGLRWADVGEGWLIFEAPEGDLGCHPSSEVEGGRPGTHSISFYCDDVHATVHELQARGVTFLDEIHDAGYGLVTRMAVPGGVVVDLYQPHYQRDYH